MSVENILENIKATLGEGSDDGGEGAKKYYGVTVGKVINPVDPMMLGRIQVQLPFIDSLDLSPWARVAVPMAGPTHGMYFIPNLGDEVLCAFEQGDVNAPYVIGSLWNATYPPPMQSPLPQIRMIRTLVGNQIVMSEGGPAIIIQTGPTSPLPVPTVPSPVGPHQTIMMTPAGIDATGTTVKLTAAAAIQIIVGTNTINVTPDGVTVSSAGNITLGAGGTINITAGAACNITAPMVKIN